MRDLKPNPIIAAWQSGRAAISAWSLIPSSLSAEVLAILDFDTIAFDMQHSMFDRGTIATAIAAVNAAGSAAAVRVPWNDDPGLVMALLDYGLAAIVCPSIGSRAECERFVAACRYPPLGIRNHNFPRAAGYRRNAEAYFKSVHEQELVVAMVETVAGLDALEDIARTPGLDVIQLGPGDLVLSRFGFAPPPAEAAEFVENAHRKAIDIARRVGIRAAANARNAEHANYLTGLGYDLIFLGCDVLDMQEYYRTELAAFGGLAAAR